MRREGPPHPVLYLCTLYFEPGTFDGRISNKGVFPSPFGKWLAWKFGLNGDMIRVEMSLLILAARAAVPQKAST